MTRGMTTSRRTFTLGGLLAGWTLLRPAQADEPDVEEPALDDPEELTHDLDIKATVDRKEFRQLQRVTIKVEVKNVSGFRRWKSTFPNVYINFRMRVFDRNGKLVPKTQFGQFEGSWLGTVGMSAGSTGAVFAPGEIIRCELVANLIYDMTRPGDYTILVEYPTASPFRAHGPKGEMYARAKAIKVKILPEPDVLPGGIVPPPDRP